MRVLLLTSDSAMGYNPAPPVGLYRLKHYLKISGFESDVLDLGLVDLSGVLSRVKAGEYGIVGVSVSHYRMAEDLSLLWKLKGANNGQRCLFVAGGQEATFNHKQWLDAGFDVIVLGYGERVLAALTALASDARDRLPERLGKLPGVAYRHNGRITFNPSEPLTQDEFVYLNFDQILSLDVPFSEYWEKLAPEAATLSTGTSIFLPETVRLYTASHCPNRCGYCSSRAFLEFSHQTRVPIHMLDAQQVFTLVNHHIERYGARGFLFSDDEFLANRKRAQEVCDSIIEAKAEGSMDPAVLFNCQARVSDFLRAAGSVRSVDRTFIHTLARAGFHSIGLGIETFNDRLLACASINKPGYTERDSLAVIDALLEEGLVPQVNIILFVPESSAAEVVHSMERGVELAQKGCQLAINPLLHDIPGAPLHEDPRYETVVRWVTNPADGTGVCIADYFRPREALLAGAAEAIRDAIEEEVESFRAKLWSGGRGPKTIFGLLMFAAAARLLNRHGLVEECRSLAADLARGGRHP
jgi:radical SAM superfamily enzyme YgiQ (UPF0313 family)